MKVIKLHTLRGDEDPVYINPEYIVSFWKINEEGSIVKTVRDINSDSGFCVKESPEQIMKEIRLAHSINPSMFTIERIQEGDYILEEQ